MRSSDSSEPGWSTRSLRGSRPDEGRCRCLDVVWGGPGPRDSRRVPSARAGSRPMAVSTGEAVWAPLWQADPVEAAIWPAAARSSWPRKHSMLMFRVFGRRCLSGPLRWTRPGSPSVSRWWSSLRRAAMWAGAPAARSAAAISAAAPRATARATREATARPTPPLRQRRVPAVPARPQPPQPRPPVLDGCLRQPRKSTSPLQTHPLSLFLVRPRTMPRTRPLVVPVPWISPPQGGRPSTARSYASSVPTPGVSPMLRPCRSPTAPATGLSGQGRRPALRR